MMTFLVAAEVLVCTLYVAVALDGATTEVPPGVVAHVLAARLLAADQTVPVALGGRGREPVASRAGQERGYRAGG